MIHPFDALKQQTQSPNKEDPNRDSWVGYSFIAAALWAVLRGSTAKAANPVTPLDESKADSKELSKGSVVELEHTDDKNEAKRIALQHLAEDPHYYSKLETVFPEHHLPQKKNNPEGDYYVFCYGSNNPAQLKERLGRERLPKSVGAYAENTARIFVGHSEKWGGAVASLERQRGKTVYGLVVRVSRKELARLDTFEGVNSGKYKRVEVRVTTQDGHELDAVAYVATTTKRGIPSQKYLKAVAKTISTHWKDSDGSDVEPSDIKINNPYTLTRRMEQNAKDSYALGKIKIDPDDFLKLTTDDPQFIYDQNKEQNLTYQDYENFGLREETIIHPFLRIDVSTGVVTGHEGRHRAAAAKEAGESFYVHIYPDYESKTDQLKKAVLEGFGEQFIPDVLIGQFDSSVRIKLDKNLLGSNLFPNYRKNLDLDVIRKMYIQDHRTVSQIAAHFGVSTTVIANRLRDLRIPVSSSRRDKKTNPIPPAAVAQEAREGLELRASVAPSRRGGTSVGIARAKQLSSRQNVSEKTMKRMKSFFARHEVDKQAKGFRKGEVGYPSKGLQAWKLWGGDSGKKWVKKV